MRSALFLIVGSALALAACGGGGTSGVASIPTPPPPPPPPSTTAIIEKATTSQEFAVKGATSSSLADGDQLHIRYDAASTKYEVRLPTSAQWEALSLDPGVTPNSTNFVTSTGTHFVVQRGIANGYEYSALAGWSSASNGGAVAFGIPTPIGGVPTTGTATFDGSLFGRTNETYRDLLAAANVNGGIVGDISLGFDFGAGTLSGSISPILHLSTTYNLAPMQFTNTVYSSGSATFSGKFDSALGGANSFSGQFTGPTAQELIGNFAFPYTSPVDSKVYDAAGAFVAKRP